MRRAWETIIKPVLTDQYTNNSTVKLQFSQHADVTLFLHEAGNREVLLFQFAHDKQTRPDQLGILGGVGVNSHYSISSCSVTEGRGRYPR